MRILFVLALSCVTFACSSEKDAERSYDQGYGDGYASGYNTTCKLRKTLVYGYWDNKDYSRGYNAGHADGTRQCKQDKRNNLRK